MPRKGENIYKRKDGRWEGRYIKGYINSKVRYGYVYAKTYRELKSKLTGIQQNHLEVSIIHDKTSICNTPDASFSVIAEEWFYSTKTQWKQSSIVKYQNTISLYLKPYFDDFQMTAISREDVLDFANHLLSQGGQSQSGLAPKTVNGILSVLKSIFKYAAQIRGLSLVDISGLSVKQPQKELRILSFSEQQKLNQYLHNNIDARNLGILICLYTGLRIGEICALKWEDISFDEQYLFVHRTMQRLQTQENNGSKTTIVVAAPKSDCSIRKIPISDNLFQILKQNRKQGEAYILSGTEHDIVEPRTMQYHFKKITKQCNIEPANFHSLRHTFATRCVEIGFEIKCLSEILGHASVNITLNRYVHPSMDLKMKNMNMLCDLFAVK